MKLRVYSLSGPAWQPLKNGKPYNKWVGTIHLSDAEHPMFGKRYFMGIAADSPARIESVLKHYVIGFVYNVDPSKVTCAFYDANKGADNATI